MSPGGRAPTPRTGLAKDLLALGAGALLPFAFAPFAVWPLALLAPAALFLACRDGGRARAAWRGGLFGLSSFGIGVSWIFESFQFAHIGGVTAGALTAAFVVFLSLFPAAVAAAHAMLHPPGGRGDVPAALGFAGLFIAGEWLRGWFLTGFTWLQLGYAQVDGPLSAALSLVGSYGVGLLGVALACTCAVAVSSVSGRIVAVLLVALAGFAAVLPGRLHDVHALGAPLRVAVLQGNVPQDQKWLPGMREPTLERYLALTRRHPDADLVVWPETAVPGSRPRVDGYLSDLDAELRRSATAALVGLPERDLASRRIYNSVELLGIARGHYRKQHLVPFGEYLPLDGLLRPITEVLGIRVASFSPGPMTQPPLRLGQVGLGVFVCYEIAFGNEVIRRLPEAALLVTVSNDAWFGDSLGPQQHLQMARARAIETGRYLVRATNTGLSAVVDPEGREILRLPAFQVADGAVSVQPMRGATVYVRGGDLPALGLALMLVGLAAWGARRRRGSGTQSGT